MVELGSKTPHSQSFDNSIFILPAAIVVLIVAFVTYKLVTSLKEKQIKSEEKKKRKEEKKTKKN